ncbi:MAG TPA: GNVR domain-containing protein [Vicinamibacterales bacterium]|nr:GNVR domain-containing protein [Vicinamibacterales bacterium]
MLPGRKLTPIDLLQIARRRAWLILLPPAITLFAALLYSSRVPNLYQSDMLVAIDPQRVPDTFVRSTVTLPTDVRMDAISVQVMSRTSLERIIEALGLYPEQRQLMPMEDVVALMRKNIEIELERTDGNGREGPHAFHVRFTHPDPNVAAIVTQQLGTLYVTQNVQDRSARAESTNRFLETQLGEARQRLEEQEHRLEAFRQRHGKELPTQMQTNMQAGMNAQMQVQSMVESLARDRDRKQLLERLYRDAADTPLPTPAATTQAGAPGGGLPADASAQQQLAAARAALASLELRYKADHPDVRRAKQLIATLEPEALAEAKRGTSGGSGGTSEAELRRRERLGQMTAEIESLSRQIAFKESEERRLRDETSEYQRRIEAVPGLESEWVALTRDYETQQVAYKDLLAKSGASRVALDLEEQQIGEHFRIVDPAGVPVHPLPSMRLKINAGGLVLGLMLGVGIAALLEFKDASFRTEADILDVLGLPVLANVPFIETAAANLQRKRRTVLLSAVGAVCLVSAFYVTWTLKLWNSVI